MSHIPPPPPFLPAPPTFNAFSDQGSSGGYNPNQSGVSNDHPPRDMYGDRPNNHSNNNDNNNNSNNNNNQNRRDRGGGRGGGRGGHDRGGRGGRRDGHGRDRERSPGEHFPPLSLKPITTASSFISSTSQYEADSAALQNSFSTYGEIKTWYDRISERGIIFVTFFDLRAAQKARDAMHGLKAGDRSIDVHYSLPRDKDLIGDCDREKNQGSILIFVHPPRIINEYELGRMCEQFGDVKTIKPGREPAEKIVEYYDSRGSALFFDRMSNQPFQGGTLELKFIWDEKEDALPPPPLLERTKNQGYRSGEGPGYGEVRGARGSGPPPGPPSIGNGPPGYGGNGPGRDPRARSPVRGDRRGSYDSGPPQGRYGSVPPVAPPGEDRLEQARKVQQLLANLGGPPANAPPSQNNALPPRNMPPPSHMSGPPPLANAPLPPPPSSMYTPRDTGCAPHPNTGPPPPGPPGGNYRSPIPPPSGNFPPYPPPGNSGPPPPSLSSNSSQGYNPTGNYPPRTDNYNNPPPPAQAQNTYNPPPHQQGGYSRPGPPAPAPQPPRQPYNLPPPTQSPYNPSTPAPSLPLPPQGYSPYPGNGGLPPPPAPPQAYPAQSQNQGYGQSANPGGYGYQPPPLPSAIGNQVNGNNNNARPGQAKDVGSLLAMLVSSRSPDHSMSLDMSN
uniref:RRM domain-containing protein n=1 Tax=Kwoniella dejecticola CBS 10117 TaxID=1296121 RepID=A0A1A6ABQ0_9TREE|nr:uncharacterized protein I303_01698 [Kwoniella dejecticola CBS 10117]OBR87492.1 hypothetical protein I303_01698 [Kwoniella dejecticola CBS 10117]